MQLSQIQAKRGRFVHVACHVFVTQNPYAGTPHFECSALQQFHSYINNSLGGYRIYNADNKIYNAYLTRFLELELLK